jgi:hypothetical protein
MAAVLGPGPSSKVSATVFELPGAYVRGPYGAAGHPTATGSLIVAVGRAAL